MALLIFSLVFLALICFLFLYCFRNKHGSPKSFPIVGMMPELLLNVHRVYDWHTETLDRCRCTFLVKGLWFGNMNTMVTCDPANIHYIMTSNFNNFPKGSEYKQMFDFLGDGIFNSNSDLWKKQRRATYEFVKKQQFHNFLSKTTRDKVENGLIRVLDHVTDLGSTVDLEDVFQRFMFDSTCILFIGNDPRCLSVEFPEVRFSKALDEVVEAIFYRHVWPLSFIKLMRFLNIGQEKKYKKAWRVLDDIIATIIRRRRKELKEGSASEIGKDGVDLITSYITEEKPTGLECDDKFLRDTVLNMMLAGRDTTSAALTWFIWLVSKHPTVENKIIEELESIIVPPEETKKRRLFNADEVKNLVYLHGALCETLRLYPPVPFQHKDTVEADVLPSGHRVDPNMRILFNLYSMGRMNSIWGEDCYEFKPERWINKHGRIKHEPSYKFLSFNAGPRTCLGREVAFIQMKMVASDMVYNYRFRVSEETPVVPSLSILLHTKNGLMTRVSSRWD
ncbi:cytochrome P450 86B1-like [Hibiscus syriacus]|uniref:Cytochrome P450 86B1-like n=1 Tax=Hibiscus syriacus TaxID=106335 RepID=A0A6A2X051_HIBSY|nr:alkane hydroxylase MAH1-like [Hibiscus syriacus]KAE8667922.1 cytochrome P450 86B1-like [Hibiscus syriacus]